MINEFKKYVEQFGEDENIKLKFQHSLRVKNICVELGKQLNFNNKDIKTIEVIWLLHDYGRFEQRNKFHTYSDSISIDHWDLAVKLLFDNNEISRYYQYEDDYNDIYIAIKYHNKLNIPNNLTKRQKILLEVIQDADKLDILYAVSIKKIGFPEEWDVSPKVKESFDNKSLINKKDMISGIDYALLKLALIFDLNFNYSFKYLKDNKIIETIYNNLTDKNKFKYYFDVIYKIIDSKNTIMNRNS